MRIVPRRAAIIAELQNVLEATMRIPVRLQKFEIMRVSAVSLALVLAVCVFVFPNPSSVRVLVALVAPLVVFRHRSNIRRILNGTESRI